MQAVNDSTIEALVIAASFSASIGGTAGVGASIGVALARNFIGWKTNAATIADYTTDDNPANVAKFKDVAKFFAEEVAKQEAAAGPAA